jgi:inner membrane protein
MTAITRDHGDLQNMASLLTHAAVGAALGQAANAKLRQRPVFWAVAILCSILPDFDVVGFQFGVRYGDLWGHRGLAHSLLFAAVVAAGFALALEREARDRWKLAGLFFVITASHGVLDALTNGGLGVAFFSPFDTHRYFLPWRPIRVSPIGARAAFSSRAVQVMEHESWIWGPSLALFAALWAYRRSSTKPTTSTSSNCGHE